jgi:predicted ester cyclase
MNNPQPTVNFPRATTSLPFAGDPTKWDVSLFEIVVTPGAPVALPVCDPVAGTLLLAPTQAGSLPPPPVADPYPGWVPCVMLPSPYLYLPSPAGVDAESPGYMLADPDTDVEALQGRIMEAMSNRTELNVSVTTERRTSTVVVNGAAEPFVVLAVARPVLRPVRRLVEQGFNQGKLEVVDEIVAEDAVSADDSSASGRQEWKNAITFWRSAFPDLRLNTDDLFAVGDKVVLRWTATGTDTGGFMERPPTGRRVTSTGVHIFRHADGLLVEWWGPSGIEAEVAQQLS